MILQLSVLKQLAPDSSQKNYTSNRELDQCYSLNQNSVRPELVEGLYARDQWFDRLTTNGLVNSIGS